MFPEGKIKNYRAPDLKTQKSLRFAFSRQLERVAFYGILATVFLTAIPYGTVDTWFKLFFVFLACVFAACRVAAELLRDELSISDPLLLAPLAGILLLAVVQIVPFDNPAAEPGKIISLNPYETRNFILTFTGLLLAGEILLRYATTEKRLRALIYTVAGVGVGSALFGLARLILPETENGFLAAHLGQKVQFAQFVNRNHFAFLMEMTLGLLTGILLKAPLSQRQKLPCILAIGLICFVTISANSRGGILSSVSLCVFAVFTHFLTRDRDSERETKRNFRGAPSLQATRFKTILTGLFFSVLLCGVSVFMVAFIGGDAVANRMETIQTEMEAGDSKKVRRHEIWQSTINLIKDHPATGIGFGAYGTAITGYDQATGRFVLQQAHNDYLEILANGGVAAFALALIFLIILFKRIRAQFASSASAFRRASCFGAIAGIIGVMLHSTVDFGLHVIVNALVFIILIVVATAQITVESD